MQYVSYPEHRKQSLDFLPLNNLGSSSELRDFMIENPILRRVYEISRDNKPIQLYDNRISLTFFSRPNFSQGNAFPVYRNKPSPVNGLIRKLGKIRNIWKK